MQVREEINGYFLNSLSPTASACLIYASKRNHDTSLKAFGPAPMPELPFWQGRLLHSFPSKDGWRLGCSQYNCILVKGNSELSISFTLESATTRGNEYGSERGSLHPPCKMWPVVPGEMKEASAKRMGNVLLESLVTEVLETYKQGRREGWEWTWTAHSDLET